MPTGARQKPNGTLPDEIYAAQVEARFSDRRSFAIGVVAASCITLITALESGQIAYLAISVLLALVGILRLTSFTRFERDRSQLDIDGLHRWERWYVHGSAAHVFLLGMFCVVAFGNEDDFARVTSVATVMAYLVGIPGRSFASELLVKVLIVAGALPILLAMTMAGWSYQAITIFVLLPFFVALKSISSRLRGIFLDAVVRSWNLSRLATRFDTAIRNMPQGLVMFDSAGTVLVSNGRMAELLQLEPGALGTGASLDVLWSACAGLSSDEQARAGDLAVEFRSNASPSQEWILPMESGRSTAFRFQEMAEGGGVILAEDVTDRLLAQSQIVQLAEHDLLTGLRNRHSFRACVRDRLKRMTGGHPTLMFIDLDQFKQVNDTLGHVVGDELLVRVAQRLIVTSRPASILSRFGGDEFVLFDIFDSPIEEAARLAAEIIRSLSNVFDVDTHQIAIGASIGLAAGNGTEADVDDLIRDADLALYRAKADGRGVFRHFEPDMQTRALERRQMEKDLRAAVRSGAFALHYQPIYSLTEKRFVVCEALLRWQHPLHGFVSPAQFIPIAEEIGLIGEIGEWVLRQACSDCAQWPDDLKVAVNVSAEQFRRGNVLAPVTKALLESRIAPRRLEIEITESALIQDLNATSQTLRQLKAIGVGIVLDDFGTGYSSLSYLRALPFSKVKIDRSFLKGLEADRQAMVLLGGIVRLSNDLGLSVVMEGVETVEQLSLITRQTDVDQIQGFYFSRPLPKERLLDFLYGSKLMKAM